MIAAASYAGLGKFLHVVSVALNSPIRLTDTTVCSIGVRAKTYSFRLEEHIRTFTDTRIQQNHLFGF